MIERPPVLTHKHVSTALSHMTEREIALLVESINERYLYWTDVKYKQRPEYLSAEELWCLVSLSRQMLRVYTWPKYGISVTVTNHMQRLCHEFDMNFGGTWGNSAIIPNQDREKYLVSSLMEEAISSSQMEGASTTRRVAKNMLRRNISPKTRSEQMIYNNYQAIRFIVDHKDSPMSESLLLQIHYLMTDKTMENPDDAGRFRVDDTIAVANGLTGEIVHYPPSFKEIPPFIEDLCRFLNDEEGSAFIHPIIKALTAHFMISFVHPFTDGNGRTARAVFYWYMLKKGYWLTEYLSVSRVIYRTKTAYENSFLFAENDRNDIGYFLTYNLRVLGVAFRDLQSYIQRKITQKQAAVDFSRLGFLNERQATIMAMVRDDPRIVLSVGDIAGKFQVSQPTAKSDIDKLVDRDLLERIEVNGRLYNYVKGSKFDDTLKLLHNKTSGN